MESIVQKIFILANKRNALRKVKTSVATALTFPWKCSSNDFAVWSIKPISVYHNNNHSHPLRMNMMLEGRKIIDMKKKIKQSTKWIKLAKWYKIDLHHVQHMNGYFVQSEFDNVKSNLFVLWIIIYYFSSLMCHRCEAYAISNCMNTEYKLIENDFGEWHWD